MTIELTVEITVWEDNDRWWAIHGDQDSPAAAKTYDEVVRLAKISALYELRFLDPIPDVIKFETKKRKVGEWHDS